MSLSKPLLRIAEEQGLKETPKAIREFLMKLKNQGYNWSEIAVICGVSTKSLSVWRKMLK